MLEKAIELDEIIDNLIDLAHEKYLNSSDEAEKLKLDGRIKAYWEVKDNLENIFFFTTTN